MPIYKFQCSKCKTEFEDLVPHRGDSSPCPKCGSEKVERMICAVSVSRSTKSDSSCADGSCNFPPSCSCGDGSCGF